MSIFVFGSNEKGIHGAGAAKYAAEVHGAQYGVGNGRTGNSYAIPTKDKHIRTLPVYVIKTYVDVFIRYARLNPQLKFEVTRIGTGLAGHKDSVIAPLFKDAPLNCLFDSEWRFWLPNHQYWGTK